MQLRSMCMLLSTIEVTHWKWLFETRKMLYFRYNVDYYSLLQDRVYVMV